MFSTIHSFIVLLSIYSVLISIFLVVILYFYKTSIKETDIRIMEFYLDKKFITMLFENYATNNQTPNKFDPQDTILLKIKEYFDLVEFFSYCIAGKEFFNFFADISDNLIHYNSLIQYINNNIYIIKDKLKKQKFLIIKITERDKNFIIYAIVLDNKSDKIFFFVSNNHYVLKKNEIDTLCDVVSILY